jgi:hypothetical protein
MTISGTVRVLESIEEFTASIDGNPISGTSVNADGTYSFTYSIPSSMSVGTHTLLLSVKDNKGKTGSKSVNFVVTDSTSPVSLTSPANGVSISFPVNLKATVSSTASSVTFYITKLGGGYSKSIPASLNGSNWMADWNDSSGGEGNYTIKARAIVGGTVYDSSTITVTYD